MEGRREDALKILREMKARRVEPIAALGEVVRVWCDLAAVKALLREGRTQAQISSLLRMHSYKVGLYARQAAVVSDAAIRRAIGACAEADAAMKSSSGVGFRPLEMLICGV